MVFALQPRGLDALKERHTVFLLYSYIDTALQRMHADHPHHSVTARNNMYT